MDPLPSLTRCYAIIHQEETQSLLNVSPSRSVAAAFLSKALSQPPTSQPHPKKVWPPDSPLCSECGKISHPRSKCFEDIEYPD